MAATEILVIILSTALALLLVLSIILIVLLIRVMKQIQAMTNTAKSAVDNLQSITTNISKIVAPATLLRFLKNFAKPGSRGRNNTK